MGRHELARPPARQDGKALEANWKPGLTYVIRIREAGTEEWSFGFETPLTHCSVVDLKPGTEYEMQVRAKNAAGEGEPRLVRIRTNPTGSAIPRRYAPDRIRRAFRADTRPGSTKSASRRT